MARDPVCWYVVAACASELGSRRMPASWALHWLRAAELYLAREDVEFVLRECHYPAVRAWARRALASNF